MVRDSPWLGKIFQDQTNKDRDSLFQAGQFKLDWELGLLNEFEQFHENRAWKNGPVLQESGQLYKNGSFFL